MRCLVLDLDETFVHTINENKNDWKRAQSLANNDTKKRLYTLGDENDFMWGIVRPYSKEFLSSSFEQFDKIGVWSTGTKSYVDDIVEIVFGGNSYTPDFVLSRKDCDTIYDKYDSYSHVLYKPLNKIYMMYDDLDKENTLIVDDNFEVSSKNRLNHIHIPKWKPGVDNINTEDKILLCYSEWISNINQYDDIRTVSLPNHTSKIFI